MDSRRLKKVLAGVSVAALLGGTWAVSGCAHRQGSCSGEKGSMKQSGCSGEKGSMKQSGCSGEKGSMKQSGCTGEKKE